MTQDWNDEAYYYDDYYDETPARRWSTLGLVLSGLLGVLIGFACAACLGAIGLAFLLLPTGSTSSSASTLPTAEVIAVIPAVPPPTPQLVNPPPPAPEQIPFASGGLGLSQQEWEQRYGPGNPSETPGYLWYQGRYLVAYQEGNVSYIEQRWSPETAITFDEAQAQSGGLIPADRQYVQTYSPDPEGRPDLVVDLYLSQTLISRFGGNVWVGGQPGNFTVSYNVFETGVTRMVITLGNNPS